MFFILPTFDQFDIGWHQYYPTKKKLLFHFIGIISSETIQHFSFPHIILFTFDHTRFKSVFSTLLWVLESVLPLKPKKNISVFYKTRKKKHRIRTFSQRHFKISSHGSDRLSYDSDVTEPRLHQCEPKTRLVFFCRATICSNIRGRKHRPPPQGLE